MPTRPDLDLSGILPSFDRFLRPQEEPPEPSVPTSDAGSGPRVYFPEPMRMGWGPDVWSTSTVVAVPIVIKWDVNGYYKVLGVSPDATRAELGAAYTAKDGQSSPVLTYIFKQLLNSETRAAYDATPLGQQFLDDQVQTELRKAAHREASKRSRGGKAVTGADVLDEWGFVLVDEPDEEISDLEVDSVSKTREDRSRTKKSTARGSYSSYRWNLPKPYDLLHEGLLEQWQEKLAAAAASLGVTPDVSYGVTGSMDDSFVLHHLDGRSIIFFPEDDEPSEPVAIEAIKTLITSSNSSRNS